jgi:DNA-binding response OmpR family regulator
MKVLIADSDQDSVEDMGIALNLCIPELEMLTTASGKECVDTVKGREPDIVILGMRLSDMDCFEVITDTGYSQVPIIVNFK